MSLQSGQYSTKQVLELHYGFGDGEVETYLSNNRLFEDLAFQPHWRNHPDKNQTLAWNTFGATYGAMNHDLTTGFNTSELSMTKYVSDKRRSGDFALTSSVNYIAASDTFVKGDGMTCRIDPVLGLPGAVSVSSYFDITPYAVNQGGGRGTLNYDVSSNNLSGNDKIVILVRSWSLGYMSGTFIDNGSVTLGEGEHIGSLACEMDENYKYCVIDIGVHADGSTDTRSSCTVHRARLRFG